MARKLIFVSCGQRTDDEVALGRQVAEIIGAHDMDAFFAQDVHSASDLNREVFGAIQTCDGFLGILQRRGEVKYAAFPSVQRSSVWIQQEIAIFCYRMFLERRSLPIRVYSERGILREGVMEIAVVNPIEFTTIEDIVVGVTAWFSGREFRDDPVRAVREELFRRRLRDTSPDDILLLELIAAHCLRPEDFALHNALRNDFHEVKRPSGLNMESIETQFNDAFAKMNSVGLLRYEADRTSGVTHVWIPRQWWSLLLDDLHGRGRRL